MSYQKWLAVLVAAAARGPEGIAKYASKPRKKFITVRLAATAALERSRRRQARKSLIPDPGTVAVPRRPGIRAVRKTDPDPGDASDNPAPRIYHMTTANISVLNAAVRRGRETARMRIKALDTRIQDAVARNTDIVDRMDTMDEARQNAAATALQTEHTALYSAFFALTRTYTLARLCESRIRISMNAVAATRPYQLLSDDNLFASTDISQDEADTIALAQSPDEDNMQVVRAVERMCSHRFERISDVDANAQGERQRRVAQCERILVHLVHMRRKLDDILNDIKTDDGQINYTHRVLVTNDIQ